MEEKSWDGDDYYVEKKMSTLRLERNVFLAIGSVCGVVFTLITEYVILWALGLL